jgi:hypothetical protein
VLQVVDPALYAEQAPQLAEATLAGGAEAVVVAAVPESDSMGFFPLFYRKLMHNWPLEYCVWAGATQLWGGGAPLAQVVARPFGEFALAISRLPAERTAAIRAEAEREPPKGAEPQPRPPAADDEWMGDDRDDGDEGDEGEWMGDDEVDFEPVRGLPAEPSAREVRVVEEIVAAADGITGQELEPILTDADELTFESEMTDLGQILDLTQRADDQARAAVTRREAVTRAQPGPRRTNVTVGDPDTGAPVAEDMPLVRGRAHPLTVAIEPERGRAQVSATLDEGPIREALEAAGRVDLDVVVFAPDDEFAVEPTSQRLELPRVGPSQPITFAVTPQRPDWCHLRVAIYYRNTMLQSLAVAAYAGPATGVEAPSVRPALDWLASTDLRLLSELPAPAFNLFMNDGPDGSHWLGVFAMEGEGFMPLENGQMRTFDSQDLTNRVEELRASLQEVHGDSYRYPQKHPTDQEVIDFGLEGLKQLALDSYAVYNSLFPAADDIASSERRTAQVAALSQSDRKLISVARTTGKWTAPWAAMYDFYLDIDREFEVEVCRIFADQLAANEWDGAGVSLIQEPRDLLDDPAACRSQASCPLNDEEAAAVTVCPFGFWGFRHELEQPLQRVTAAGPDELPPEMEAPGWSQTSFIMRQPDEDLRVAGAFYPAFPGRRVDDDIAAVERIFPGAFDGREDRTDVMDLLASAAGHHLFYFFCHGRETRRGVALEVGPAEDPQNTITVVPQERMSWAGRQTPQPFVILMACESLAMRPDEKNALFAGFKNAGASGLVGSEITIGTRLGHEFGTGLLGAMRDGRSAGEAFAELRRDMLRRYNPLGLALTLHAPSSLHIHPAVGECGTCARLVLARADTGSGPDID